MSRRTDDAYNRLDSFENLLRKRFAFVSSLSIYQPDDDSVSFEAAVTALCDDIKTVLGAVEDGEDWRERLHDVVMIQAEREVIGGGPGFAERSRKAWDRASEPFEP